MTTSGLLRRGLCGCSLQYRPENESTQDTTKVALSTTEYTSRRRLALGLKAVKDNLDYNVDASTWK